MLDYPTCLKLKENGFPQMGEGHAQILNKKLPESDETVSRIPWCWFVYNSNHFEAVYEPTLSELIEAVGRESTDFPWGGDIGHFDFCLQYYNDQWTAGYKDPDYHESWSVLENGKTPEEAVANLYLALAKSK